MLQMQHVEPLMTAAAQIAVSLLFATAGQAQPGTADRPVSYVASVKPNHDPAARTLSEYSPGGRLTAVAIPVVNLIRIAYRIQGYQLVGLPTSIASKRYDLAATVEGTPAPPQQTLLRALLKDRFGLAIHEETREMPVLALTVARKDGKLGPQLRKSDFDCAAYLAAPRALPDPTRTPNCATRIGLGTLSGKAISMAQLATSLAPFAGRFTIDRTGLAGLYDVELTWTPDPPPGSDADPDARGASLFSALSEQLGLKLSPDKAPVPVFVVDRIAEPSAN